MGVFMVRGKCHLTIELSTTFWKRQNYRESEHICGCKGLDVGGGADYRGTARENFCGGQKCSAFWYWIWTWLYEFLNILVPTSKQWISVFVHFQISWEKSNSKKPLPPKTDLP